MDGGEEKINIDDESHQNKKTCIILFSSTCSQIIPFSVFNVQLVLVLMKKMLKIARELVQK
jgi:hypothetical protein